MRQPIAAMGDKALRYLEALQAQHPGLAPCVGQLADLYQRKLWHQASAPHTHLLSLSSCCLLQCGSARFLKERVGS